MLAATLSVGLFGGSGGSAEPEDNRVPAPATAPVPAGSLRPKEAGGEELDAIEAETDGSAPETLAEGHGEPQPDVLAALREEPSGPTETGARAAVGGPMPAQIARLIEASRERSGARPGGD